MCSCQEWQGPAACVSSGLGDAVHSFWTRSLLLRGQLSRISEGHACSNLSIDRHQKYDFDYVDVQCIDMCLSAACLSMFRQLYMTQEAPESWRNWNHERAGSDTQLSRLYTVYIIILYTSLPKHFHGILELDFSMKLLPRNAPFAAGEACHLRARATAQKQTSCLDPMTEVGIAFLIFLCCSRRLAPLAIVKIVPCLRQ